jgi:hypothetical protein
MGNALEFEEDFLLSPVFFFARQSKTPSSLCWASSCQDVCERGLLPLDRGDRIPVSSSELDCCCKLAGVCTDGLQLLKGCDFDSGDRDLLRDLGVDTILDDFFFFLMFTFGGDGSLLLGLGVECFLFLAVSVEPVKNDSSEYSFNSYSKFVNMHSYELGNSVLFNSALKRLLGDSQLVCN